MLTTLLLIVACIAAGNIVHHLQCEGGETALRSEGVP
jgi:hypothetical protein